MKVQTYSVSWNIQLDAHTPEDAARLALIIMRDPNSIATVFQVEDEDGNGFDIEAEGL